MTLADLEQLIERIGNRRRQLKIDASSRCAYAVTQLPGDFHKSYDSIDAHLYWFYEYVIMNTDGRQYGRPMDRRQIIQSLRPTAFFDSVQRNYGSNYQVIRDILRDHVEGGRRKLFSDLLNLALQAGLRNIIENELARLTVPRLNYAESVALADKYVRRYWSQVSILSQKKIRDAFVLPSHGSWLQGVLVAHFEYSESLEGIANRT